MTEAGFAFEVMASSPDGFALYDHAETLVYVNPGFCSLWKVDKAQVLGLSESDVIALKRTLLQDPDIDLKKVSSAASPERHGQGVEPTYIRLKDGTWYERLVYSHLQNGLHAGTVVQWRNVTVRQNDLLLIQYERDLMQAMMDSIPDQIFFKDRDSHFLRINKALAKRYGLDDPAQAIGKSDADYYSEQHAAQTRAEELAIMETREPLLRQLHHEHWSNGSDAWNVSTKMALVDPYGQVIGTYGIAHDITEQKRAEALIWQQANFDSLTELPNRRLLRDRWEQAVQLHRRTQQAFAFILIDLDQFKEVNDSYGHAAGDLLLVEVARRMVSCLRATDTLARLGGDEFAVLLTAVAQENAIDSVARNLLHCLSTPFILDDHPVSISGSLGISIFPDDAQEFDDVMRQADRAMYEAKRQGKNRFFRYSAALATRSVSQSE